MSIAAKYRTSTASIADIAAMIDASYRTAQRVMALIRKEYGLAPREKPTMAQVKSFLIEC